MLTSAICSCFVNWHSVIIERARSIPPVDDGIPISKSATPKSGQVPDVVRACPLYNKCLWSGVDKDPKRIVRSSVIEPFSDLRSLDLIPNEYGHEFASFFFSGPQLVHILRCSANRRFSSSVGKLSPSTQLNMTPLDFINDQVQVQERSLIAWLLEGEKSLRHTWTIRFASIGLFRKSTISAKLNFSLLSIATAESELPWLCRIPIVANLWSLSTYKEKRKVDGEISFSRKYNAYESSVKENALTFIDI